MSIADDLQCTGRRRRVAMLRLLGMRLLTRLLLLVCSLSLVTLLFLSRCGLNLDTEGIEPGSGAGSSSQQQAVNSYIQLLQQREDENRVDVERLTAEIRSLKLQLLQLSGNNVAGPPLIGFGSSQHESSSAFYNKVALNLTSFPLSMSTDCAAYVRRQLSLAEISQGLPLNNEYELIAFSHFTVSRVYPVDLGLGKRVVEKPIGFRRKDLLEALITAIDSLNKNFTNVPSKLKYGLDDFMEGLYRSEPTTGTQYELYFRTKSRVKSNTDQQQTTVNTLAGYTKVTLMRPFVPIQTLSHETLSVPRFKELIHIILPLSGRTTTFQGFMDKFVKIALKNDRRVRLTVVYFGEEGLSEARAIMARVLVTRNSNANNLRLLALNESFSRGKGLRVGAEKPWDDADKGSDALLFLCDVDVVFSVKFLDRCRWNTEPGRKVYYPIVFSLYNPHVVYTLQGKEIPPETDQLVISRDTGFWRDFGYGMTCQYRSDFLKVRGFDEDIVGWGGEDVALYRKYVRSHVKVIRGTDPGIFHIWHPKVCSGGPSGQRLSADQYRACIRSRALNEASHAQLGFLAFRDDIANNNIINGGSVNVKAIKSKPPRKSNHAVDISSQNTLSLTKTNAQLAASEKYQSIAASSVKEET